MKTPQTLSSKALQNAQPALIQGVDENALVDLLSRGVVQNIPAGSEFVREGKTRMAGLYMILEGMVGQLEAGASGVKVISGAMGPGEFLGEIDEMGEVTEGFSRVTLKAHSACQLMFLSKVIVDQWLEAHATEQAQFMRYLARESSHRKEFASGVVGNA
jgi:CRP-like cAMP-binding protein